MSRARIRTTGRKRERVENREPVRRRLPSFLEYETFEEQQNDDGSLVEINDEDSWGGENTPQDVTDSENPEFQIISSIRPLWLLYKGRLMWAGARLGRDIPKREHFRRRIQAFLDFLAVEFPEPDNSDEDRLLAMQGLFMEEKEAKNAKQKKEAEETEGTVEIDELDEIELEEIEEGDGAKGKNNKKEKDTAWLGRLDKDGIVYGNGKIISLKMLRTKQGGGGRGGDSCPRQLLLLWLARELKKHPGESPLEWRNCKDWIMEINDFLSDVNDKLNNFAASGGIGLKDRHFHYAASTVQKKHLGEWKKWWEARA